MMLFRPLRFVAPYRPPPARHAGFSLVELTIAVLIASILLTMGLAAFSVQVEATALSATQKRQDTLKEALIAYLRTHRRLPCPETTGLAGGGNAPIGRENRSNGTPPDPSFQCTSYVGTPPWLELGLTKEAVLDGYGNFFTYFVAAANSANDPDWTRTSQSGVVTGFNAGSLGRFAIQPTSVDSDGYPLPALAAAVIISHGKNGFGAITEKGTRNVDSTDASELANQPPTAAASPPSWSPQSSSPIDYNSMGMHPPAVTATLAIQAAGGIFDDVVLVLRPNDLLGPIIRDGAMKSAEALVQEQLAIVRNFAIAEMLAKDSNNSNECTPKQSLNATLPIDPWGSPIQYQWVANGNPPSAEKMSASDPAQPIKSAFQIWSLGPNRIDDSGSGDDKVLQTGLDITYGQILSHISVSACP